MTTMPDTWRGLNEVSFLSSFYSGFKTNKLTNKNLTSSIINIGPISPPPKKKNFNLHTLLKGHFYEANLYCRVTGLNGTGLFLSHLVLTAGLWAPQGQ